MIRQISILPALPLRPYIREYHWIGSDALLNEWMDEDNLPFPSSGLCFQFGRAAPVMITHGDTEREALPAGYVLPPSTERFTVHFRGGQRMLAVIFHLAAFFEFFGWPLHEFSDRTVPLGDTDGRRELLPLQARLKALPQLRQQAEVLDAYFLGRLKKKMASNPTIRQSLDLIAGKRISPGRQELLRETGVSSRHLRRLFNEHLGMPPRAFLRILRFYRAYWALAAGRYDNLTRLALDTGYYDQAHFIHDFHHFTGLSPHQFLEREFKILDKVAWKNGGK